MLNPPHRQTLLQSIVDNDLLSAVRRWLEPLPDRTLPSLGIQTAFFEILVKVRRLQPDLCAVSGRLNLPACAIQMDIDTPTLKSCGLGKIVIFYTKSRRSTLRVKRLAERLQLAWLRPLVKKSSAYRTKVVEQVDVKERKPLPRFKTLEKERGKRDESLTPGGERSEIKAQSIGNKRRGARIPMSSVGPRPGHALVLLAPSLTPTPVHLASCRVSHLPLRRGTTRSSHRSRHREEAGPRTSKRRTRSSGSAKPSGSGRSRLGWPRLGGQRKAESGAADAIVCCPGDACCWLAGIVMERHL